jgi:hypothetical protein
VKRFCILHGPKTGPALLPFFGVMVESNKVPLHTYLIRCYTTISSLLTSFEWSWAKLGVANGPADLVKFSNKPSVFVQSRPN